MKLGIIRPKEVRTEIVDVATFNDAVKLAGLNPGELDFGALTPDLHVAVFEFGLFQPPEQTSYFAIGKNLTAGNAVIYSTDKGETVDLVGMPPVFFFGSVEAIEQAIRVGQINRPEIRVNGELLWKWPDQPAPWGRRT